MKLKMMCLALMLWPVWVLAQDVATTEEVAKAGLALYEAIKAGGGTLALVAAITFLLMQLLKWGVLKSLTAKIPRGLKPLIVLGLAGLVGILQGVMAGEPLANAIGAALIGGPWAMLLHSFYKPTRDAVAAGSP